MKVILGSSSKWRQESARQLLKCDVELMSPNVDEVAIAKALSTIDPRNHCQALAKAKLDALLERVTDKSSIIMCFDTIIVYEGQILEKPEGPNGVETMINLWNGAGRKIQALTGVAIGQKSTNKILTSVQEASINMLRPFTQDELHKYITSSHCETCSGAVMVELFVEWGMAEVEGEQSTIEGFPHTYVLESLRQLCPEGFQ